MDDSEATEAPEMDLLMKRSGRYYRRYPWKRQNGRSRTYVSNVCFWFGTSICVFAINYVNFVFVFGFFSHEFRRYETEARYLCVPSREDVYKLLVGLHENRNGNHQTTVNFCNRKRPAKAIFTNIRFLG